MIRSDFHSHSNFSDGAVSPREMVEAAIAKGLARYGLSDHGYAPYDLDVCIPLDQRDRYVRTIRSLQEEYAGRIDLKLGLEMDAMSEEIEDGYDYKIGSVHYVKDPQGRILVIDYPEDCLRTAADTGFGGDVYALLEAYWQLESEVVERTDCDIIGHFDLCAKYAERKDCPFDREHPRYLAAWKKAADCLLKTGRPFEINMGAIAKNYRSVPYPHPEIARYLIDRGASFVLSSDSHRPENIAFAFDRWEEYYRALGANIIEFNV